jgi:hypothetical protein
MMKKDEVIFDCGLSNHTIHCFPNSHPLFAALAVNLGCFDIGIKTL